MAAPQKAKAPKRKRSVPTPSLIPVQVEKARAAARGNVLSMEDHINSEQVGSAVRPAVALLPTPTPPTEPTSSLASAEDRLYELTQVLLEIKALRSRHLWARRPRIHERPLQEQWAIALAEVDRLALRVDVIERALVQVALNSNAHRMHLGQLQIASIMATAHCADVEPALRRPPSEREPAGRIVYVEEYVAGLMRYHFAGGAYEPPAVPGTRGGVSAD